MLAIAPPQLSNCLTRGYINFRIKDANVRKLSFSHESWMALTYKFSMIRSLDVDIDVDVDVDDLLFLQGMVR